MTLPLVLSQSAQTPLYILAFTLLYSLLFQLLLAYFSPPAPARANSSFFPAPPIAAHVPRGGRLLITGGTGYLSGWLIKSCLEEGYKVRTTVRKLSRAQDYLRELPNASSNLEIVECELESPQEAWDAVVANCDGVFHVASPMDFGAADPYTDLVMPQLTGTERILYASRRHKVHRVVITSSSQTMSTTTPDWHSKVYGENDWNTEASLELYAYPYSKLLQEQLAAKFSRDCGISVVTILPYSIMGPAIKGSPVNSNQEKLLGGAMRGEVPFCLDFAVGFIDVRDCALVHLRAMQEPRAHGRYVCWSETWTHQRIYTYVADIVRPDLKRKLPRRIIPRALDAVVLVYLWLTFGRGVMQIVRGGMGKIPRFDVARTQKDLGVQFRSVEETIEGAVRALEEWKRVPSSPR